MIEQQRLIIAVILSTAILVAWQYFFIDPNITHDRIHKEHDGNVQGKFLPEVLRSREEVITLEHLEKKRLRIENQFVHGSINLVGARIDDLTLSQYKQTLSKDSPDVTILSPGNSKEGYFVEFGWIQGEKDSKIELPTSKTQWSVEHYGEGNAVLSWCNSQGVLFKMRFILDNHYLFQVLQDVENNSDHDIALYPYVIINRSAVPMENNMIIHEGAIGAFNKKLIEVSFADLKSDRKIEYVKQSGWAGFSDKYWLVAVLPGANTVFNGTFSYFISHGADRYQVDLLQNAVNIAKGQSFTYSTNLFAGAKKLDLLDKYEKQYNALLLDHAVDFGMLYLITKPMFLLLNYFYALLGNFGVAILLLTVVIKFLLFPLAYRGFISMNKLKVLQPRVLALKERYQGDHIAFQKAIMALYKQEKANPVSGCLPIILQMPVFFALYKVLYVTIEMRQAAFFGWIQDLSVQDPTTIFNLFGLIPWAPPSFLNIGILPILMALTMHIQQRLNPEPSDPIQAKVMKLLPWIFLFMFASFPSGLVLYWVWSNVLSILQQCIIKSIDSNHKKAGNCG